MATTPIPIRSVTKNITPNGANFVLLDDGVAMGKASLTDAVTTVAGPLADTKIAALNLDTASTHPATDFATAAQGTKADSAIQPSAIGDSVQAHSNRLQSLTDATGVEGQVPNLKLDGTFELADAGSGDMRKNVFDPNGKEADAFDQDNMADGTTNKNYTATEKARVADAVTNSDTSTAAMDFVLDEDDLTSNSATKLPTQASIKANIDARAPKGRFNTVAAMLADTDFGYASARFIVVADDRIETDGYLYDVAASGASDHDVTTAGGVKLYVVPSADGSIVPQQFAAACNGAFNGSGTDDTAALQKFAASTRSRIKVITGCSKVTAALRFNSGDRIEIIGGGGLDGGAITDMAGAPALLYVDNSANLVNLTTLSSDVAAGDIVIPLTDASSLTAGDWICLYNPTDYSWIDTAGGRDSYREGEWVQVAAVSGNNVTLYRALYFGYTAASISVYRLRGEPGTSLRGGRIKPPGAIETAAFQFDCCVSPMVEHVRTDGSDNAGGRLIRCVNMHVDQRIHQLEDTGTVGNDYGLHIGASAGGNVFGDYSSQRHGLSFGNADYPCCVPNRDIIVLCNTKSPRSQSLDVGGHGCSDRLTVMGGRHVGGLVTGGGNMTFIGCVFEVAKREDSFNEGVCVYASENRGGDHRFVGCTFLAAGNAVNGIIQYVLLGGMKKKLRLFFDDCNFIDAATGQPITVGMLIQISGCTFAPEVYVNGGMVDMPSMTQLVRLQRIVLSPDTSATTAKLVVDNPKGVATNAVMVNNAGTGLTIDQVVQRGREARGITNVAISGAATATQAITWPKAFDAKPVLVTMAEDAVGNFMANAASITTAGATLRIRDVDNTSRTGTVPVHWSVAPPT